jgi:hypothetical protein
MGISPVNLFLTEEINMETGFEFGMTGYGYCSHLKDTALGTTVIVKVLSGSSLDDVQLDLIAANCEVAAQLHKLYDQLREDKVLLVQFKANYSRFGYYHIGLTQEDPEHMVQFKGRLVFVRGWIQEASKKLPEQSLQNDGNVETHRYLA